MEWAFWSKGWAKTSRSREGSAFDVEVVVVVFFGTMSGTMMILTCIVLWGMWGIFAKLSNVHNSPAFVTLATNLLYALFSLPLLAKVRAEGWETINWKFHGLFWIVATGVVGVSTKYVYNSALSKATASQVVPATAVYPVVTVLLAVIFLKERMSWGQGAGLVLCMAGVYLMTMESGASS